MARKRITLEVQVDLDPSPGIFHTEESAVKAIEYALNSRLSHYNPTVTLK